MQLSSLSFLKRRLFIFSLTSETFPFVKATPFVLNINRYVYVYMFNTNGVYMYIYIYTSHHVCVYIYIYIYIYIYSIQYQNIGYSATHRVRILIPYALSVVRCQ